MATRYGEPVDLKEEIKYYLEGAGGLISRFSIRDFVVGDRGVECAPEELEEAITAVEQERGEIYPEGSLGESMRCMSKEQMEESLQDGGRSRRVPLPDPPKWIM